MLEKLRILVIEDTQSNIDAAKAMLANHEVTVMTGYDQAHEVLVSSLDEEKAIRLLGERLPEGWKCLEIELHTFPILLDPLGNKHYDFPVEVGGIVKGVLKEAAITPFDVVLTDVMIPKGGNKCMSNEGAELVRKQGIMPYGPVIAIRALQAGVKKVGILTSGSHHADPFVFAFDGLDGFETGDVKLAASNGPDVEVDSTTYEIRKRPNYNSERVAYDEFQAKIGSGQIIYVKNWVGLLDQLLK